MTSASDLNAMNISVDLENKGCSCIIFQREELKLKYYENIYWIEQMPRSKMLRH